MNDHQIRYHFRQTGEETVRDPKHILNEALARIRRTTVDALSKQSTLGKHIAQILKDIDVVEAAVREFARDLTIENPRAGRPRDAEVVSHYSIEHMPSEGEDALAEHRTSGAQPFRCPRETYMTAAKVVASAVAPLKFSDLLNSVQSRLNRKVPAYQLRLCLRFWSTTELIQHRRARFVPRQPSTFERVAARSFKDLVKAPVLAN